MSLPKFEAASLDAAAMAMGSPAGWLAAAFVAADVAALCGVGALEWCWLSVAERGAR